MGDSKLKNSKGSEGAFERFLASAAGWTIVVASGLEILLVGDFILSAEIYTAILMPIYIIFVIFWLAVISLVGYFFIFMGATFIKTKRYGYGMVAALCNMVVLGIPTAYLYDWLGRPSILWLIFSPLLIPFGSQAGALLIILILNYRNAKRKEKERAEKASI